MNIDRIENSIEWSVSVHCTHVPAVMSAPKSTSINKGCADAGVVRVSPSARWPRSVHATHCCRLDSSRGRPDVETVPPLHWHTPLPKFGPAVTAQKEPQPPCASQSAQSTPADSGEQPQRKRVHVDVFDFYIDRSRCLDVCKNFQFNSHS